MSFVKLNGLDGRKVYIKASEVEAIVDIPVGENPEGIDNVVSVLVNGNLIRGAGNADDILIDVARALGVEATPVPF